ncbi:S9 family peptidase [Aequorivita antarctica]|uniref:S9 family peptidase n=1 Tax=Aequorivita antarctica TaxID=153266 RepID=UPI000DCFD7DA|nr:prolyl oligopeptidase family serine peptidase [Aequorivita antarctica]
MKLNRIGHKSKMVLAVQFFLALIFMEVLGAQVSPKLQYTSNLNSQWSKDTNIHKISSDGQWIAISEVFPENKRTVWLMATDGSHKFQLPDSESLNFSSNSQWFACIGKGKELINIDLKKLSESRYSDISYYSFSPNGHFIAAIKETSSNDKEILLINHRDQTVDSLKNVTKYEWHPTKNILFVTIKKSDTIQIIQYDVLNRQTRKLFTEINGTVEDMEVGSSGNSLAFISSKDGNNRLNYVDGNSGVAHTLTDIIIQNKFLNFRISDGKPNIDNRDKKIIFYLKAFKEPQNKLESDVQVWDSSDPWIEPRMEMYREQEENYFLTAWYPESGKIMAIGTPGLPTSAMRVNHDYALVYDQLQYEPLYKFYSNVDLFVKNINTGDTTLVSKNQYMNDNFVTIAPNGQHLSYFKNNHWWLYTISNGQTINLTNNLEQNFQNTHLQYAGDLFPWGNPGWIDNETIILYDEFDIWLMSADGKSNERITRGRETNNKYRILKNQAQDFKNLQEFQPHFPTPNFSSKEGIILSVFDNKTYKSGLSIWKDNHDIKPLLWVEGKIDQVFIDESGEKIIFRQQRFDQPITINCFNLKKNRSYLIHQSNKGLLQYDLGTFEFIDYKLNNGIELQGSLIYPSNYNPNKKYPLIVEIYERESFHINNFEPPSDCMDIGFNLLKFTLNDYFVLLPDISYAIGKPGISALNSVTAAVTKVLESGEIDEDRIGLIGHSFGGYETAFIVSQTNLFATAVAGAAVTDLVNYYHDVNWEWNLTQMWRIENQQFRMGDSFYKMKENYYANSPLTNVEQITTPLLLWTGKNDTNVNWNQSVNMFLGLKRLGKKAQLLLYRDEGHTLQKTENQQHLTTTIYNWMETYLKKKT